MKSYNKFISDLVLKNIEGDIKNMPQPHAFSNEQQLHMSLQGGFNETKTEHVPTMYGGKRVRSHPQCGHTAYSTEPATLLSSDNLMFDHGIYGGDNLRGSGQGNENLYMGGSFWDDIGNGLKNVGSQVINDVILPVGKEVGKDALKSYLKGGDMLEDAVENISDRSVKNLLANAKKGFDSLTRKLKGGDVGSDILNGLKSVASTIVPFLSGLGRKPKNSILDHIHPVLSHLHALVKHAHSKGGNVGDDILNGLKQAIPIVAPLLMGLGRGGSLFGDIKNFGKQAFNDVVKPVAVEMGKDAIKSYIKGSGKRGRPSKAGNRYVPLPEGFNTHQYTPSLVGGDFKSDIEAMAKGGKKRGRPSKKGGVNGTELYGAKGGDIGSDILNGISKVAPFLMMGLGKKPRGRPSKCGGSAELYPPSIKGGKRGVKKGTSKRGEIVKKVMKEKGLNLAQASKYVKEHNLY